MKRDCLKILIFLGFLIPTSIIDSQGQDAGLKGLSLKLSPGALAYYGELSPKNLTVTKSIANSTKFGASASIIKQIRPFFGIQGQFFIGSLYSVASDNTYFAGSLSELSLSARLDPLLLFKRRSQKFSPYLSAGIGAFGYRSVHRMRDTNVVILPDFGYQPDGITNSAMKTAMSLPLALGFSYQVLPFLQIEIEHSIRMTNTDLLDCVKSSAKINDMYSQTSIGLRFSIPAKSKNQVIPEMNIPMEPLIKSDSLKTEGLDNNLFIDFQIPDTLNAGQILKANLRINKGKYSGSAKLIQNYPEGFAEIEDLSKSTVFSYNNQKVEIDWNKMPEDSIINYAYSVKIPSGMGGNKEISGSLEYQDLSGSKTVNFKKTIYIDNQKGTDKTEALSKSKSTISSLGNIKPAQPKEGIEFRVQCGAFRENSKADVELASKHHVTELIQEESINGWYKYTVGSFRTYNEAAAYRDSFITRSGILSAFIVAYKDGRRLDKITDAFK